MAKLFHHDEHWLRETGLERQRRQKGMDISSKSCFRAAFFRSEIAPKQLFSAQNH